jgi:hypothetical protein
MSPDGYNPYRIGRDGIDWEVLDAHDPWSHIGYWGDHQVIYLLRLLEAAQAHDPALLTGCGTAPVQLRRHALPAAAPRAAAGHAQAHPALRPWPTSPAPCSAGIVGDDGLLVCDDDGMPLLATLGEKLAIIVLAKAGSLLPGGGLWLHTQRPEWNDANNALVGNGLSVVTLAHLRRLLGFLALPGAERAFALDASTLQALQSLAALVRTTPLAAVHDAAARRAFLDGAGALLDPWRAALYSGMPARSHRGAGRAAELAGARAAAAGRRQPAALPARRRAVRQLQPGRVHARPRRGVAAVPHARRPGGDAVLRPARAGRGGGAARHLVRQPAVHGRPAVLPALSGPRAAGLPRAQPTGRRGAGLPWCSACWPSGGRTCCSARATARCASRRRCPTGPTWKPPGRPGRRPAAAGRGLRPRAEAPRVHRPLGHHVRLRGPGLHLLAHGGQAAAGGAGAGVRGFRPGAPNCRAAAPLPPRARRPGLPQERGRVRRLPGRPVQPHGRPKAAPSSRA